MSQNDDDQALLKWAFFIFFGLPIILGIYSCFVPEKPQYLTPEQKYWRDVQESQDTFYSPR